jgi:hypothetical protein
MIGTIVGTYYAAEKKASWGKSVAIGLGIDLVIGVAMVVVPFAIAAAAGAVPAVASIAPIASTATELGAVSAVDLGQRAARAMLRGRAYHPVAPAARPALAGFGRCAGAGC